MLWLLCHFSTIAMMAVTSLLILRHHPPVDYRTAITILLYGPMVGVNTVAGCVARGSRRLWLRSGESRTVLYTIGARLAWHALALLGIPLHRRLRYGGASASTAFQANANSAVMPALTASPPQISHTNNSAAKARGLIPAQRMADT